MTNSFGERVVSAAMNVAPIGDPVWQRSLFSGFGNARSLVKLGSILAAGGSLYGHTFLSEETVQLARQQQIYTHDLVLDMPVRFGLGLGLASKEFPLPFRDALHWGGYGGSSLIMDPDTKACWCYVPNRPDPSEIIDPRGTRLIAAACAGVAEL
jgi:CubicO group peptidase (beta-lactamase class C family)